MMEERHIFFVENDLMGILPISNRMVVFDATILHKATSFRMIIGLRLQLNTSNNSK